MRRKKHIIRFRIECPFHLLSYAYIGEGDSLNLGNTSKTRGFDTIKHGVLKHRNPTVSLFASPPKNKSPRVCRMFYHFETTRFLLNSMPPTESTHGHTYGMSTLIHYSISNKTPHTMLFFTWVCVCGQTTKFSVVANDAGFQISHRFAQLRYVTLEFRLRYNSDFRAVDRNGVKFWNLAKTGTFLCPSAHVKTNDGCHDYSRHVSLTLGDGLMPTISHICMCMRRLSDTRHAKCAHTLV